MTRHLKVAIIPSAVRLLAGVCAALAIVAQAAPYELRYTGSFSNAPNVEKSDMSCCSCIIRVLYIFGF